MTAIMVTSRGLVPSGWTCFCATFILCCILLLFGVSVCFYHYHQGDRSVADYGDELTKFLTNQGVSRVSVNAQARSPNETNLNCVQQGKVSSSNSVHQVEDTHKETKLDSKQDAYNTNQAKSTKETNKSAKEDNSTHKLVKSSRTENKLHTKQDKSSTNQTEPPKEIKMEDNSPTVSVNQVKSSKETMKEDNPPTHQPSVKESESPIDPLSSSRQDNSATHQTKPSKEELDSKVKQDNSPSVNQANSSKESMKNTPTHQVKPTKESESSPYDPLSSIIEMNSTHINGKLLEPVDTKWDKNIYFSVKTTAKYFKERLAALMPTWIKS
ncbi:uncharacterized G-patch domain protein DDB_G0278987-like [Dysidea avara]|uniref:uncharacterized G-patch domain protein DDB_G0278987-like n=1 Tax=Dysidea avara TaxID=196820 RepID=UPI0033219727